MNQSTNYDFNLPIGGDLVNLLTQLIPNWESLDTILKGVENHAFTDCTEVTVLGVHAISRVNSEGKILKWVATSNYTAGETFTVDGNVVAASTPAGASLATGAYVTGSIIIAALNADESGMTIFVSGTNVATDSERLGGELPAYYATATALANAVQTLTDLNNLMGNTSIAAIGDGTATGAISALNSDLADIKEGLRGMLDFSNAVLLTGTLNYTVPKNGALYGIARSTGSSSSELYINGNGVGYVAGSGTGAGNVNPIYIDGIEAGSVITTTVSLTGSTSTQPSLYFIPYK